MWKDGMAFVKDDLSCIKKNWQKALFGYDSKIRLLWSHGLKYSRRPIHRRNFPRYQIANIRNGGGNIMVWCFYWTACSSTISSYSRQCGIFWIRKYNGPCYVPFACITCPRNGFIIQTKIERRTLHTSFLRMVVIS